MTTNTEDCNRNPREQAPRTPSLLDVLIRGKAKLLARHAPEDYVSQAEVAAAMNEAAAELQADPLACPRCGCVAPEAFGDGTTRLECQACGECYDPIAGNSL